MRNTVKNIMGPRWGSVSKNCVSNAETRRVVNFYDDITRYGVIFGYFLQPCHHNLLANFWCYMLLTVTPK